MSDGDPPMATEPLRPLSERELTRQVAALQRRYESRVSQFIVAGLLGALGLGWLLAPESWIAGMRHLGIAFLTAGFQCAILFRSYDVWHVQALMKFGRRATYRWKREFFYTQLDLGLHSQKDVFENDDLLDWGLLGQTLRETRRARLRTKILQLAVQFRRVEYFAILDEHYGAVGLNHRKLAHDEAAALATARLVLRPLAALEPGARLVAQGVER